MKRKLEYRTSQGLQNALNNALRARDQSGMMQALLAEIGFSGRETPTVSEMRRLIQREAYQRLFDERNISKGTRVTIGKGTQLFTVESFDETGRARFVELKGGTFPPNDLYWAG